MKHTNYPTDLTDSQWELVKKNFRCNRHAVDAPEPICGRFSMPFSTFKKQAVSGGYCLTISRIGEPYTAGMPAGATMEPCGDCTPIWSSSVGPVLPAAFSGVDRNVSAQRTSSAGGTGPTC